MDNQAHTISVKMFAERNARRNSAKKYTTELRFLFLVLILTMVMAVFSSTQEKRLKAYNDCYMAKYQDWSTDCYLGADY